MDSARWSHPLIGMSAGRTTPPLARLTIMALAGSTSDRAKAPRPRAEGEHRSTAQRNEATGHRDRVPPAPQRVSPQLTRQTHKATATRQMTSPNEADSAKAGTPSNRSRRSPTFVSGTLTVTASLGNSTSGSSPIRTVIDVIGHRCPSPRMKAHPDAGRSRLPQSYRATWHSATCFR